MKIREAKAGNVQLSQGKYFLMAQKFLIKKGRDTGKPIYNIKISELQSDINNPDNVIFVEIKTFLLSEKQYEDWVSLLIQLGDRKLEQTTKEPQKKL